MTAVVTMRCQHGHKWDQSASVKHTGIHVKGQCPECRKPSVAELIYLCDLIQHCPDCGHQWKTAQAHVE